MSDEIRLQTKTLKNPSTLLDWVPIVGGIRMNRFSTERSMVRKMSCFGWHFDGFSSEHVGTEYRVYGDTVTAHENYSHYLRFCRPEFYYGNKFFNILEWLFLFTLPLYRICNWIWLITLIIGGAMLNTSLSAGLLLMFVPLGVVLFSNLCCFIGKKLNKKAEELTKIVLDGNGYETKWGITDKELLQIAKRIRKNRAR